MAKIFGPGTVRTGPGPGMGFSGFWGRVWVGPGMDYPVWIWSGSSLGPGPGMIIRTGTGSGLGSDAAEGGKF